MSSVLFTSRLTGLDPKCGKCGVVGDLPTCPRCQTVHYCSISCFRALFKTHKEICKSFLLLNMHKVHNAAIRVAKEVYEQQHEHRPHESFMVVIEQTDLDNEMCITQKTSLSKHEIDLLVLNNKIVADSSTHGVLLQVADECAGRDRAVIIFRIDRVRSRQRNFCCIPEKSSQERLFLQRIESVASSFERVMVVNFESLSASE
jgi:hypothetical protein